MPSSKELVSRRKFLTLSTILFSSSVLTACRRQENAPPVPTTKPSEKPTPPAQTTSERSALLSAPATPTRPAEPPQKLALKDIPEVATAQAKQVPTKIEAKPKIEQFWLQEISPIPQAMQIKPVEFFKVLEGVVYTTDANGIPQAISKDGKKLWSWEDQEKGLILAKDENLVYLLRPDQRIYALDTQTGKTKWKVIPEIKQGMLFRPQIINQKETIHLDLATRDSSTGTLLTIDKNNQKSFWLAKDFSVLDVSDGVILGLQDRVQSSIHGLDVKTGQKLWSQDVGEGYFREARYKVSNKTIYYVIAKQGEKSKLEAREIATGKKIFEVSDSGQEIKLVSDEIVCVLRYGSFGNPQQIIEGIDPKTKSIKFTLNNFDDRQDLLSMQGNFILHAQNTKGITRAVDILSGKTVWENDDLRLNLVAGREGKTIVATSYDIADSRLTKIHFIDISTGKNINPPIVVQNTLHAPIFVGNKICLATQNGLSVYKLDGTLDKSIPVPIFNGFLLQLSSVDSKVLAVASQDRVKISLLGINI